MLLLTVVVVMGMTGCVDASLRCCLDGVDEEAPEVWERAINSAVVMGPSVSSADAGVAFPVPDGFGACLSPITICTVSWRVIWWVGLMKTAFAEEPATSNIGAARAACAR